MSQGWICLHRQMLEWEWYSDVNTTRLFIHCLLKANHKEKKWQGKVIPRGSFITGRSVLAEETGLTEQQIRTAINKLKSTNNITIKATNKFSLVTLVGYDLYQDKSNEPTSKITNKPLNGQPTDNQQVTTTNNDNNNNNDNNKENKSAKLPKFSQDDLDCAHWFYGLLKQLNPNHKEPNFEKWADEIRKIVNIDKRSYNEISDLMLWVNQDNFWQTNVLSPSKLRDKWDQLTIAKNKIKNQSNQLMSDAARQTLEAGKRGAPSYEPKRLG